VANALDCSESGIWRLHSSNPVSELFAWTDSRALPQITFALPQRVLAAP